MIVLTLIRSTPPDSDFPFIQFAAGPFKSIIANEEPCLMDKRCQNWICSDDKLNIAFHSDGPNILFLGFERLQILVILLNDA